jgi:serine/threonine protein kinase
MKNITSDQVNELKQSLRLMHYYKIIHFDIKPENIMFSSYFDKPVFIDYGFS